MKSSMKALPLLLSLTLAASTWAQSGGTANKDAFAEGLFRKGQALMKAGKIHEACEKFSASYQIDPALGTLLNLAVCHEQEGKIASAWTEFTDALARATQAGQKDRVTFAQARLNAIEPKLIKAAVAVLSPVEGMEVKVDGGALPPGAWDTEMPIDPGEHVVEATAPGKKKWETSWRVDNRNSQRIVVPALEDLEDAPNKTVPSQAVRADDRQSSSATSKSFFVTHRRDLGYALDIAGGAMLAGGVVFGILAKGSYNDAKNTSDSGVFDDKKSSTKNRALVADILYGVGAVTLGTGLYFTFTSPKSKTTASAALMPVYGGGGVMVTGGF